jgi:predicted RNase H-like HicB family nuclease
MFSQYVDKAMRKAKYELIEDGTYFASIEGFQGLWGNGPSIEECRDDLKDALEGWLVLGLWQNDDDIPVLGKLSLVPRRARGSRKNEPSSPQRSRRAS